jgi:hypothetical protein
MSDKEFEKELDKAEQEFFEIAVSMVVFLHQNEYDLDTIRDMLIAKVDNALDEYERKIK